MAEGRYVPVPGARLYCETRGGNGPPVLFVHGFPLSGEMWQPTVERLERAGDWRMIVPDLRGHGRSEATAEASMARYADDLAGLLEALGESRPVVLVGLSMGGIIGFEFFRRHRARLGALVLVCTRANAEPPEGVARREATAQAALRDGSRAVADAMIGNLFAPGVAPELRQRWYDIMAATPATGAAAAARSLGARPDSIATLPRIDVPTLVVAGDSDAITPPEGLREIHAGIRGSRFVLLERAGHLTPVERPDAFAGALGAFLHELERARA